MKRRLVIFTPLALASCSSLLPQQKYIPTIYWPLQPPPPMQKAADTEGLVLLVRDITAAPGLDQQGVRVLQPDGSVNIDYYNRWAADPADATTQALTTWLQASGYFSAVIPPGSRLTPSLILEGELTELLAEPGQHRAIATLTLVLAKANGTIGAGAQLLLQQRITGTAPLTSMTPASEVAAQQTALAGVMGEAVTLIASILAKGKLS